jgi:FMN phosphatase YigB (HAD superfamily)
MDKIVYTWEYGPEKEKPHPHCFTLILRALAADADSALFIGDNPGKDCRGAHGAGIRFAQVLGSNSNSHLSMREGEEKPEFVIQSLLELPQLLQSMK